MFCLPFPVRENFYSQALTSGAGGGGVGILDLSSKVKVGFKAELSCSCSWGDIPEETSFLILLVSTMA